MSLPARPRHRWDPGAGDQVAYVDLGDILGIVPGGTSTLRSALLEHLDDADWAAAEEGFGDPDLVSE